MIDDLIFFEKEEYTNAKRINALERTVQTLTEQLNAALNEITLLKQQFYDHINFQHDIEQPNRFHITHVPKSTVHTSSSSDCILIDV